MAALIRLADVKPVLARNYVAGTNVFLRGKPAIGKTQTIEAWAEEMGKRVPGFRIWFFYAPTMSPMDIQASAPNYETGELQIFNNTALPNAYKDPDVKGCVFLGELPNTDPATGKLLQKYINGEDMSGVLRKPKGVMIVADGNRMDDKSGVQQQGRAFMSRFIQLEAYSEPDDNIALAAKRGWHPFVQTFFRENVALIDNYDEVFGMSESAQANTNAKVRNERSEEGKMGIWANMRSWERVSQLEQAAETMEQTVSLAEMIGNVGQAVAAQYHVHKEMIGRLASFESVVSHPETTAIPTKLDELYTMAMLCALRTTVEQFPKVRTYCERMPLEMQAVVLKTVLGRTNTNVKTSEAYLGWLTNPQLTNLITGRG